MSDLISRNQIYNYVKKEINPYGKPFEGTAYELGVKIMDYIENMTTAEVVPVVYCKECKQWGCGLPMETDAVKCCGVGGYMVGKNGYCVYGERKE